MHAILDVAEWMLVEHMDGKQREKLYRNLYRPDPTDRRPGQAPKGFEVERQNASFDALQAMLG